MLKDMFVATFNVEDGFIGQSVSPAALGGSMTTQLSALLLLVEDDELLHPSLEDALSDGGFEVKLASSGAEGLALLETHKDAIRGLITDINLGKGPDGWDVARHARELIHDLPVVYMSGASAHEWTSHGVPNSVLIAKPFALAQIVTAISTLINVSDSRP
jgi:DNA-binding response OmpR family regulator